MKKYEVRGHCMCKGMLVIPVSKVVDPKRIIGKMAGRGGGDAQIADTQKMRESMFGYAKRPFQRCGKYCLIRETA
jgi:hypothetical protein